MNDREKVLRKIGRRSYSSYELNLKLKSEMPEIKDITDEFLSLGYLNDEEWLSHFIAQEERKGKGPHAIAGRLNLKGFPKEVIDKALSMTNPEEAIKSAVEKQLRKGVDKPKAIAALARRGFSWDLIKSEINDNY